MYARLLLNTPSQTVKQQCPSSFVPDVGKTYVITLYKNTIMFNYEAKFLPSIEFEGITCYFALLYITFFETEKGPYLENYFIRGIVPMHFLIIITRAFEQYYANQN